MAISAKTNRVLSGLKILVFHFQRWNHTMVGEGTKARFHRKTTSDSMPGKSSFDISTWKTVDSRTLGIRDSMISSSSLKVLNVLQNKGFEAYLVGGCVRDLLLGKTPKDFDVVTTADLKKIWNQFHRSILVGRRFPICLVNIKGSIIEVSSFETVAKGAKEKETVLFSQMPTSCDKKDFVRWRNCMHRDFTINSLFFDPLRHKIYDYTNGMKDLKARKVRTIIPAELSFNEDCARILRGLRIAARLDLSFSEETAMAMRNLSSSIGSLDKAAYLAQHASNQSASSSSMLMKLFFNVDNLLASDRPCNCSLWVGLLAFHIALVNKPQDAVVIWTFSSLLYHGKWGNAVKLARENVQMRVQFVPEILKNCSAKSDEELAKEVTSLASLVKSSMEALTKKENLLELMARYPLSPCSGLVFISQKTVNNAAKLFDVLLSDVKSYVNERENYNINYDLLGKGDKDEIRFVLGKVIMDTMNCGIVLEQHQEVVEEKSSRKVIKEKGKHGPPLSNLEQLWETAKEEHLLLCNLEQQETIKEKTHLPPSKGEQQQEVVDKKKRHRQVSNMENQKQVAKEKKGRWGVIKEEKHGPPSNFEQQWGVTKKKHLPQCNLEQQAAIREKKNRPPSKLEQLQEVVEKKKCHQPLYNMEHQKVVVREEKPHRLLSSLFR